MENSFKSLIESSKSVLILLPSRPYLDQVAAGLSLYLGLRGKKEVQIACPTPMTVEFNRLIGVNKIAAELGNKNLVIRFSDYKANDIERVSYDIEDGQFRLSVIPKPGVAAPQKEQVNLSYSGISSDLVILVGGANETHFPAAASKDLVGTKLVHIGVRDLVSETLKVISFARPASSVSEIICQLMEESDLTIDADVATNLIIGIEDASGEFSSPEVTAETFELVAKLLRAGGQRILATQLPTAQNYPVGAIPGQLPTASTQGVQNYMADPVQSNQPEPFPTDNPNPDEAPDEWLKPKVYKGTSVG